MFVFEDPSDLSHDWYIGDKKKFEERISNKNLKNISNADIISIQFLFENFIKKRKGAILNEEKDFNMPLQVCTFMSIVKDKIDENTPVLVVTSAYSLCKWHYHASEAGFKPKIITPNESEYVDHVYLLDAEALKLTEKMLWLNFFCVVIDNFDELATKLIVKKLKGTFNIGLTQRNFYQHPDQKLKWTMLNWASPGCVGKLADFYRIDRQHFLAFSDNYRYWWMRLTWKFCDSFEPPTEEYFEEYQLKLQEWSEIHNLSVGLKTKLGSKRSNSTRQIHRNKRLRSEDGPTSSYLSNESDQSPVPPYSQKTPKHDLESEEIDVKMDLATEETDEDLFVEQKDSTGKSFQEDAGVTITKDDEYDDPILSIIYSDTPCKIEDSTTVNVSSNTNDSDSKFFSFLLGEESSKCEISKSGDIADNNRSEGNTGGSLDDESFFSDFILGNE